MDWYPAAFAAWYVAVEERNIVPVPLEMGAGDTSVPTNTKVRDVKVRTRATNALYFFFFPPPLVFGLFFPPFLAVAIFFAVAIYVLPQE